MPKKIENVRGLLIAETKKQLTEKGYSAVTVRSVAGECGIGTGTFYNYFKSKDILIAMIMLEDWQDCLDAINSFGEQTDEPEKLLYRIYCELNKYIDGHNMLFEDTQAKKIFSEESSHYHGRLRGQLAEPIFRFCTEGRHENAEFLAEFIAESLITWTIAGKSYNDISGIILRLL